MSLATRVFDALQVAQRPCTRTEIEAATSLVKDEVYKGLCVLKRAGLLVFNGAERRRATYALIEHAQRPADITRGRYARAVTHRALQQSLRLAYFGRACVVQGVHSAARPTTTVLTGRGHAPPANVTCTLAEIWRRKR